MERILRKQIEKNFKFDSLIVFENIDNIPKKLLQRLLNIGDKSVSLEDKKNLKERLKKLLRLKKRSDEKFFKLYLI